MFAYYGAGSECHFCPPPLPKEKQAATQTKQKNKKQETTGREGGVKKVGETGSPGALVWLDAEGLWFFGGDNEERPRAKGPFNLSDVLHRKKFGRFHEQFFNTISGTILRGIETCLLIKLRLVVAK